MSPMGNTEMGTIRVINAADQPNQLIPDNYTGAGIKKYTKARKESLAKAWNSYVTETGNPNADINSVKLTYIPREGQPIDIVVPPGDGVTEALAKTDAPINDDQPDNIPPEDRGNPPKGTEPSQDNGEKPNTDSDAEPPQPSTLEDNSLDNEPPTPPTVAKYAVDDIIENGKHAVIIVGVNKLNSGGYSYIINRVNLGTRSYLNETWEEKIIDDLISQHGYKLKQKTPTTTDADVEPDTTFDDLNGKDRQEALEEILKDEDSPEEEAVKEGDGSEIKTADNKIKKIPDLNFSIFGYSFNTFYSGINYDKNTGEVVVTPKDVDRVDAGMGLYNIDPALCQNETQVVKIIGALRSAAMYCNDNGAIIRIIQSLIPKLENKTLEIQWAFVSKSEAPTTNEKYYRFTPASDDGAVLRNAPIDNHGEKSQMQYKTISMIVRKKDPNKDDGGVTLLEIPLLTLSSPQTILCKIGEQNPKNPAYKAFKDACNSYKNDQQQFHAMNAVIKYINENEQDLGNGYKKLRALCKLWLFTNNGVKFIGDPSFNLVKSARNLGVKFIGSRIADEDLVDNNFTLKKLDFTKN